MARSSTPATGTTGDQRHARQSSAQTAAIPDPAKALAEPVRRLVDAAPPLTAEQIEQLRGLLPAPGIKTDE